MPALWGHIIVIGLLAATVFLAARYLWKARRAGGRCTGSCASCGGCGAKRPRR